MSNEDPTVWRGRHRLLDPSHAVELEARSTVHQLGDGMSSADAESRAYAGYLAHHLTHAAAHHLAGVRAAHAVGDKDTATRHGLMYGMIMRTLGHDPHGEPPAEIHELASDPLITKMVQFKPHGADALFAELARRRSGGSMAKAEDVQSQGGYLLASDGGYDVWDMSHLLSRERRLRGERLHVHETATGRSAHHLSVDGDRRVPLASGMDENGKTQMAGEATSDEVKRAMDAAFKLRRGVGMAQAVSAGRGVDKLLDQVRKLISSRA